MYKSPIDMLVADIQHQIASQQDEQIYQAVVSVGVSVDKEELIRALKYDRDQYHKGYLDGASDAIGNLVRCKHCKHRGDDVYCPMCFEEQLEWDDDGYTEVDYVLRDRTTDYGFCYKGERRNDG